MRKVVKISFYCFLGAACFFASCSEVLKPDPLLYTQIFTGTDHKSWSITNLQFLQDGKGDVSYQLQPCELDNQYIFYANTDRHYQVRNGAAKCDTTEGDVLVDDTWSYVTATATLTANIYILGDQALPFIVKSADKSQMTLEIFADQDNTSSYRIYFKANSN